MSLILAVHSKDRFFEYFLPGINNRHIRVDVPDVLRDHALTLSLEVWNHKWSILPNETMLFGKAGEEEVPLLLASDVALNCRHRVSGERFTIVVVSSYEGYSDFDKYQLSPGRIEIGSAGGNNIRYNTRNLVSSRHAHIETDKGKASVITDTSSNGTYVNDVRIHGSHTLRFGDVIYILGLKMVYIGGVLAINKPLEGVAITGLSAVVSTAGVVNANAGGQDKDDYYQRSPRQLKLLDDEAIEIEAPPNPQRGRRQPLLLTIGPSITMVIPMTAGVLFTMWSVQQSSNAMTSPFMFMGIITSVTAATIGVFWALTNYRYSKRTEQEDEERRSSLYRIYLERMRNLLEEKHRANREALDSQYPDTRSCLSFSSMNNRRLWERNVNHQDFLAVRIGRGDMHSPNPVAVPKERFSLVDDSLSEEPRRIKDDYRNLQDVPITLSLREHPLVGVIGSSQSVCNSIAQVMALQIASYHSYTDVRMAFIYNEREAEEFAFARWLPHSWSEDGAMRMVACDQTGVGEVFYNLAAVLRGRVEAAENAKEGFRPSPHYVIFISDPSLVESEALMKYLSAPTASMGISAVLIYHKIGRLPNNCTTLVQSDGQYSGYYSLDSSFAGFENVKFDKVTSGELEAFARSLSGIKVRELQAAGAIPQVLTFLDMYRTSRVEDIDVGRRWLENRTYESMRALIGYRGAEAPLYLDVHEKYHGPHGLVAGTTGSGKSETLQTYILSLGLNYHPHEVSFILIDYKGGGMAGSFARLPHVAGIITNLGGNQTNRALASINSEIKRRQALLNEHKLKHIDGYIELFRAGKTPLPMPHLLIIADEFAELKKEQPEFVRELVSASRVGRSLGVHLILATQKPSGVVDEEIWGNAKFRLCLRVQDKHDSVEMIKRPEAAYITNAGRGYFQVGNDEIFEAFQSGWSGAKYDPDTPYTDAAQSTARMINLWGKPCVLGTRKPAVDSSNKKKRTQLDAAVEYIAANADTQGVKPIQTIWLPPLPTRVHLAEIAEYAARAFADGWREKGWELRATIGVVDDPVNQRQVPLSITIVDEGHILVSASSSGGKTTLLQTLLYSLATTYSPDKLNIYVADFGSRTMGVFSGLPHVGGVVFDSDTDKVDKLVALLISELASRKVRFSERGIGSFKEYARSFQDVPAILFAIDNFAAFSELCAKQEDNIILLSREAASYGIYLIITCTNANDIRSKIRQNIGFGIGLQLADRFEYESVINAKTEITAEARTPGRGLVCYPRPLEFQTALPVEAGDAILMVKLMRDSLATISAAWNGPGAKAIPQVPEDMSIDSFAGIPEVTAMLNAGRHLPLGYDAHEAVPASIDLARTFCYTISGTPRSGKTNLLKALMVMAQKMGGQVFVYDGASRELENYCRDLGVDRYLTSAEELFDLMQDTVLPEFTRRNFGKVEYVKDGRRRVDDYLNAESKVFLFIGDMSAFCDAIYNSPRDMKGFMEQMASRGDEHMIYLVACVSHEDMAGEYGTKRFLRSFVGWKQGIHLGGDVERQKVFEFDLPLLERRKKLPCGVGYVAVESGTRIIVTPEA